MKQIQTQGIVLSRTDYGEADRILTLLTPDQGKLRLMARGVRKIKSKLAGGIELFSTSHIGFIRGRSDLATLTSSRLIKHYGRIVRDIERVQLGYDLIKLLNKATEDHPEAEYYELLEQTFAALDNNAIDPTLISCWFQAQLLRLAGHTPNLTSDTAGQKLQSAQSYNFDIEAMAFLPHVRGSFQAEHVKTLRLMFSRNTPQTLTKVEGLPSVVSGLVPLIRLMLTSHIRT